MASTCALFGNVRSYWRHPFLRRQQQQQQQRPLHVFRYHHHSGLVGIARKQQTSLLLSESKTALSSSIPLMPIKALAFSSLSERSASDLFLSVLAPSKKDIAACKLSYQRSFYSTTTTRRFGSSSHRPSSLKIAVIGAGVAGLQTLRAFKAHDLDVTAFEASDTVGGNWRSNYSNFSVQVPKQLYEFQDYPMTTVPWGEYATGRQFQSYVEAFTDDMGLRDSIQFNSMITSVEQNKEDKKWMIHVTKSNKENGASITEILKFDYLVMARGLYSGRYKHIPTFPGQEKYAGETVHSVEFCDANIVKGKRVLVIGGGKSAIDCALEASKHDAASVILLQRTSEWPTPRKIAGIIPFQYVFYSRFGTALVSAHRGTFPGGSGKVVNAFRNSIGPFLMRPVFGLVEELFAFQFNLYGDLRPKVDVVTGFYQTPLVLNSDLKNARKSGKVNVQLGEISEYVNDKTICLKDGSKLEADLIVFATGFQQDYSMFSDPKDLDIKDDGMYMYRYIIPENVSNLAFIGHVGSVSNISTYGIQAEWLARNLKGSLVSGGTSTGDEQDVKNTMRQEIQARQQWARSWMPESPYRGMQVLLHQTHYHDQLLRDMGINPHRKNSVVSEYLMPYEPADYNGIMGIPASAKIRKASK